MIDDRPVLEYTIQQAAAILGVHTSTIRRWTDRGFLHASRTPGGHRRYSTADLNELSERLGNQRYRPDDAGMQAP